MWTRLTVPRELLERNLRSQRELSNWRYSNLTFQDVLSLTQRVQVSKEIHSHHLNVFRSQGLLPDFTASNIAQPLSENSFLVLGVSDTLNLPSHGFLAVLCSRICVKWEILRTKEPNSSSRKKAFRCLTLQGPCVIPVITRTEKCHM